MMDTCYLSGLFAGVVVGGVATYALLWRVSEHNHALAGEVRALRVLLNNLQSAESRYRSAADQLPSDHCCVAGAWDRLKDTGDAARRYLFARGDA